MAQLLAGVDPQQSEVLRRLPEIVLFVAAMLVALWILVRRYRSRRELLARAAELTALAEIGRSFANAPLEPEELAEVAYQEAARILETDNFLLGIFEKQAFRTLIWARDGERIENRSFPLDPEQGGLIGWIRRTASPLLVHDFDAQRTSLPAWPAYESPDPPRSGLFVPLLVGDEVLGVIAIQSRRRGAFGEHQLRLLTILANGVAPSLAMTSLRSQVDFRTLQLVLMREISNRLVSLQPLPELFGQVARLFAETLHYPCVRLFECIDGNVVLRGATPEPETADEREPGALVRQVAERGLRLASRPADDDAAAAPPGLRAQMAVPLMVEERVLGVLEIRSDDPEAFPPDQAALAETVAAHLALAVLEARNFASQQEEAWITTVLLEVARHAARPGETDQALQAVLQLTTLLAGTTWAALLLPDPVSGHLAFALASGLRRQTLDELVDLRTPAERFGIVSPVEAESPIHVTLPDSLSTSLNTREATAVALSDGRGLLGLLLVEGQQLAGRRLSLLVGIAHQISLRLENTRLIEEVAARRSMERELGTARRIQESFLPTRVPEAPGWEVGATWRVAREVGGDFYDFIPLPPGPDGPRWGIVIADVADKGVPAALFMALCRTLLRSVAIGRIDPGQTLCRVNDLIFSDSKADLFVSVIYALWEPQAGRVSYANGGHNPPLLFMPEVPASRLTEHGMVLGVSEHQSYETCSLTLPPGALLVLYTDGVTEAADSSGEFFGLHRLENLILGMEDRRAQAVADAITERVLAYSGDPDLDDDLTAVALRRLV